MRVDFNASGFSAEMDSPAASATLSLEKGGAALKAQRTLILGIIAFIISLGNLPFGLFMNMSTEILSHFVGVGLPHWVFVLFAFSAIMLAISILCGVFSIISFAKSKRQMTDAIGMAMSIISFVISCTCILLNIVGLTAW